MAIIERGNEIILTGETARDFRRKIDNPDPEVMRKRDAYLRECREWAKTHVEKRNGKTYIKI